MADEDEEDDYDEDDENQAPVVIKRSILSALVKFFSKTVKQEKAEEQEQPITARGLETIEEDIEPIESSSVIDSVTDEVLDSPSVYLHQITGGKSEAGTSGPNEDELMLSSTVSEPVHSRNKGNRNVNYDTDETSYFPGGQGGAANTHLTWVGMGNTKEVSNRKSKTKTKKSKKGVSHTKARSDVQQTEDLNTTPQKISEAITPTKRKLKSLHSVGNLATMFGRSSSLPGSSNHISENVTVRSMPKVFNYDHTKVSVRSKKSKKGLSNYDSDRDFVRSTQEPSNFDPKKISVRSTSGPSNCDLENVSMPGPSNCDPENTSVRSTEEPSNYDPENVSVRSMSGPSNYEPENVSVRSMSGPPNYDPEKVSVRSKQGPSNYDPEKVSVRSIPGSYDPEKVSVRSTTSLNVKKGTSSRVEFLDKSVEEVASFSYPRKSHQSIVSLSATSKKPDSLTTLGCQDLSQSLRGSNAEMDSSRISSRSLTEKHPKQSIEPQSTRRKYVLWVAIVLSVSVVAGGGGLLAYVLSSDSGFGIAALLYGESHQSSDTIMKQFLSSLQVQKVDDESADWSSDLKELESPRAQKIIDALTPKIRSAFESEGFTTDGLNITRIGPISVTIYHVLNKTVTTLSSSDEIAMASSYEIEKGKGIPEKDKPHPQGHRLIIRVEFETSGKPSDNADMISQFGDAEAGKIQFMIGKYLENQGVVAQAESLEVFPEFRKQARSIEEAYGTQPTQMAVTPEMEIDCYKTGKTLGMTRVVVGCPRNCDSVNNPVVFGTDWYHKSSMVCLAAIHSYVIEKERGGIVEFLMVGNSFLFPGSTRNGVKSASMLKFGKKFMVKKPGPSWTTTSQPSTTTQSTARGLQEPILLLLTGQMTAISIDNNPLSYSLSLLYSSKLASDMRALLRTKLIYSLEDMGFFVDRLEISGFQPDTTAMTAIRVMFEMYGGYAKNAPAMFPFKPWDRDMISKLIFDLKINLGDEGLHHTGLTIDVDSAFLEKLKVTPSTAAPPVTPAAFMCTCTEVFVIQSATKLSAKTSITHLIDMYKKLFDVANFDQFIRKIGMAIIVPRDCQEEEDNPFIVVSDVGEKESHDFLADLEFELLSIVEKRKSKSATEAIWQARLKLKKLKFFSENFETRAKLLVINSDTVFGPSAKKNTGYFDYLKSKGIKVLYLGHGWEKFGRYPQAYVSEPAHDFVKHVRKEEDVPELASYVFDVMRKYVCDFNADKICSKRSLDYGTPSVKHDKKFNGSYLTGLPMGSGLKPYQVEGVKVDSYRRTEPDVDQAFYMSYECGKPAIQPEIPERRIVGGTEAVAHSWPWTVSINRLLSKLDTLTNEVIYTFNSWKCGGTIISSKWVVTAAHCFAKGDEKKYITDYKIVTGRHDQSSLGDINGYVYNIRRIIHHPYYDDSTNKYDIALLRSHLPMKFSRTVSPACLPNPDVIPEVGKMCVLAGWGFTSSSGDADRNLLKQASQFVEDPKICQSVHKTIDFDANINFCTKKSTTGRPDMQCRGDSGGPLTCFENRKWIFYGVANWGPNDCETIGHGGYALVPSMMEWICCYITTKIGPCLYTKCNTRLT